MGRDEGGATAQPTPAEAEGGEAACWAHLVCPECGAVEGEEHRPDCRSAPIVRARA